MRGFEFLKIMPEDIDEVRYLEGVTASSECFDAVIHHIPSLLSSYSGALVDQHSLDTKEYYKIQTPFFNIYKRNPFTPMALDVWPNMHNRSAITSEEKQHFDNFAIMLFEYMVELSIFFPFVKTLFPR